MTTIMMFALALAVQDASHTHVRAAEPRILALMDAGLARSETFRRLVAQVDASDVIVYVEAKRYAHPTLGGYMVHDIISRGGYRYIRVAVDVVGSVDRLVAVLGHELQHVIEI